MPVFRRTRSDIGVNIFFERNSSDSVPKVGEPSVNEARLCGGVNADSRFGDFPGKVVLEVFFEVLLVSHVSGDISHHDGSIAETFLLIIYVHNRFDGRLEGVLWVGVPVLSFRLIGSVFGSSKEVSSSHPHKPKRYP